MELPLVSVIIVTYNNKEGLEQSIPSLLGQSYRPLELIVVDNASLDRAAAFVRRRFPQVKVLERGVNDGFGAGCNAGAKEARGEYLVFANEDMVFERDYVRRLVAVMEEDGSVGACQGTTYQVQSPKSKVQSPKSGEQRKRVFSLQSVGLWFNPTGFLEGERKRASALGKEPVEIFAATVPFLIRRGVFERVGGFDEDFFLYFEEVDLCWRIWLAGYRVVCVPTAHVYHKGGVSTGQLAESVVLRHSFGNRIHSFAKNLGLARLAVAFFWQVVISFSGAVVFLLRGKFTNVYAIFLAWMGNVWQFKRLIARRKSIQRERQISDAQLFRRVGGKVPFAKLLGLLHGGRAG